ncbi:GntR family transcriptional regulator [Novosphingobium capsulatum]|uniref:GntR family transcriptional regulator n=1 Tax=Novosphingobium capsulatum TaxID=13688 RepID=A0ABU1MI11_9SPHN|nr:MULTISPECIES: GntR family transcriptional regulator [Novosphingobium]KPF55698.1 GntR family transcriptional regulator [Novosphingobium sp. AAP1]MBB3357533.1 GntR family transcriptional regulator [Novosphingobium sp. BK256]MBB3373803.1 GntR family transcriptional regulator [Novosphingobium sp. BK280]MBB3378215.1 GntR family transcriptional regulator [Novosphingobium sp. BK258]MBB3420000.1 GntR family transcriptional regulator [Novosphingobium sp. BK267]
MAFVDQIGALRENEAGPRYMRLQKLIRHAVDSRRLAAGAALPSERDLCEEYGLSRVTIRKAIDGLVEEGLLERRQGAGTFVSENLQKASSGRVEKSFSALSSFSEDMMARGRKPGNKWIDRSEGLVTPEESLSLGLSPGSKVYRFQRIRYADGVTMALEGATVPGWGLPSVATVENSLYTALQQAGHRPVRALQRVRAIGFPAEMADLLGIAAGDPCLFIERRAFLPDGRVIEITHSYYRGDAYDLVAELSEI